MTAVDDFFQQLLSDTDAAFLQSPVCQFQYQAGYKWNYSVCGTPLQPGKGIILGINWGADGVHEKQTVMPDGKDVAEYIFMKKSRANIEDILELDFECANFNYTNLCFFRTPAIVFLSPRDYRLSLPLFRSLVEFINPPWIFSLGNSNYKVLSDLEALSGIVEFFDKERKHKAVKGKLWGFDFYSVPHPGARVKAASRKELWV